MQTFILATLSFLSVVGMVELIRKLVFWLKRPPPTVFYMGAVIQRADEAEAVVRSLIERIRWMEFNTAVRLILVDKSNDPEVKNIVDRLIKNIDDVIML